MDALKAEGEHRSATALLETLGAENYALAAALNKLEEEYAAYKRVHSREHVKSLIRKEKAKLADRIGTLDYEVKDLQVQLKKANQRATEADKKCREAAAGETRARSDKKKENYNLKVRFDKVEEEKAKLQKDKDKLTETLAEQRALMEELDKVLTEKKNSIEKLDKELVEKRELEWKDERISLQRGQPESRSWKSKSRCTSRLRGLLSWTHQMALATTFAHSC